MDFKNAEAQEYEAYRQRYNHLSRIAQIKNCKLKTVDLPSIQQMREKHEKQQIRRERRIMSNKFDRGNAQTGVVPGIVACVLAVLGIFTIGTAFVPLAAIVALVGTIIAAKNVHWGGIGVNVLAWVLTVVGLFTSPVLLTILGFGLVSTG